LKIRFSEKSNTYWINDETSYSDESLEVLLGFVRRTKNDLTANLSHLPINSIKLAHYDSCLSFYCDQRLDMGMRHRDTCWVKDCEDVVYIPSNDPRYSRLDKLYNLNTSGRLEAWIKKGIFKNVVKDVYGNSFVRYLPPLRFTLRDLISRMWYQFKTKFGLRKTDRILKIVDSIRINGWLSSLSLLPHPSVLIYYRKYNVYGILTGRHRIGAACYAVRKKIIPNDQFISAVVISVPWGLVRTNVPYPSVTGCDQCIIRCNL
jgi:hypothetical protein